MSYFAFQTAKDLKTDALFLAGEPQDGSSQFDSLAYPFLSTVQNCLISGGVFGPEPLIPVSWLWARKYPRGTIQMVLPFNDNFAVSATFTAGSTLVTLSAPFTASDPDITNWRLWMFQNVASSVSGFQRPYVQKILTPTSFQLKDPWTDNTFTTTQWLAFQAEYDLPRDFVRFASPIFVSGWPYSIDVVEPWQMEKSYPFSLIGPAVPVLAAVVAQSPVEIQGTGGADTVQKVRFSHFLGTTAANTGAITPLQLEFEYIFRPEPLYEGNIPAVPLEHRRIISFGGAYLILEDKADNERDRMWARFRTAYRAMVNEYRQSIKNASTRWGVPIPRFIDEPRRLRTESGLVVW